MREHPEKDYKDVEGSGGQGICGAAKTPEFAQPRTVAEGGFVVAAAPHKEQMGSAEFCCL